MIFFLLLLDTKLHKYQQKDYLFSTNFHILTHMQDKRRGSSWCFPVGTISTLDLDTLGRWEIWDKVGCFFGNMKSNRFNCVLPQCPHFPKPRPSSQWLLGGLLHLFKHGGNLHSPFLKCGLLRKSNPCKRSPTPKYRRVEPKEFEWIWNFPRRKVLHLFEHA
jgi:hypothetical protein